MNYQTAAEKLGTEEVAQMLASHDRLAARVAELTQQLNWFQRQIFGKKSEKRSCDGKPSQQMALGEAFAEQEATPVHSVTVAEHSRKSNRKNPLEGAPDDSGLRFDETVPVEIVQLPVPEIEGLTPEQYEVISEQTTYRLAQKPSAYYVIKFVRPVVKLKATKEIVSAAAPWSVHSKSYADVTFLVGMLVDKLVYHLPLYRLHQKLDASGIKISRGTLSNIFASTIDLLVPIYRAQLKSVKSSLVVSMDETSIKAGRKERGIMRLCQFWPMYGDKGEVVFPFATSKCADVIKEFLGEDYNGVLLTDGNPSYIKYIREHSWIIHAACWAHTRREFWEALAGPSDLRDEALRRIAQFYQHEAIIREKNLVGVAKLAYRQDNILPLVEEFFTWLEEVVVKRLLLHSDKFLLAAAYALSRKEQLKVFLSNPEVAIDTNHLERALRVIPMGRKNYLFCWTEGGAERIGIMQSLIVTCRLQGIDPYSYLVDVLQRIDTHPSNQVELLTPRLWKDNFSQNPLPSPLEHYRREALDRAESKIVDQAA